MEDGIKSGKIQGAASSSTARNPFIRKKEVSDAYGQRNHDKVERRPMVRVVMISNPTPTQQQNNQRR